MKPTNFSKGLVAHATSLNIDILPEIDVPGHSTAVLKTYPRFADQAETPESYHSIQGYPNNALNPAMDETYEFLEKVFAEVASLFPFDFIHIGGDEVTSIHGSPLRRPNASWRKRVMRIQWKCKPISWAACATS